METDKPTKNKLKAKELPKGYNTWSSTVILFKEEDDEITVYAFDADNVVVYYVVSYPRDKRVYAGMGYIAGTSLLFFFGKIVIDLVGNATNSKEVDVYSMTIRKWLVFPNLNAPKPFPFVFFIDMAPFVLSSAMSCARGQTHFERFNWGHHSWEFLDEPSFVWKNEFACHHGHIADYSKEVLYVRLLEYSLCDCKATLYGYDFALFKWQKYENLSDLTPRTGNLLKASWSNCSVIVEDYLYSFRMFNYSDGLRAMLVIRDLEHEIEVNSNAVEPDYLDSIHDDNDPPIGGIKEVNISRIVAPDVLHDMYAAGYLVYLGKKNLCQRFSVVISYACKSCGGNSHVYACTFDVTVSTNLSQATAVGVSSPPCQHINVGPSRLACHKLGEADKNLAEALAAIAI